MSKRPVATFAQFNNLAPRAMRELMAAFPLTVADAAAILGNAGHESNGFRTLQEVKPTVAGSKGGYGWFQWTGPRRREFEAWAKARSLSVDSYEANVGFMTHELRGKEAKAIQALLAVEGLEAKVIAFEKAYERAGVKHYPSRIEWAKRALAAYGVPSPDPVKKPVNPKPLSKSRTVGGAGAAGAGGLAQTAESLSKATEELQSAEGALSTGTMIGLAVGLLIIIGVGIALYARWDDAGRPLPWKGGE